MATGFTNSSETRVYSYIGLSSSENGDKIEMNGGSGLVGSVQAFSGGGTGFNSANVTIQVSNDGTTWATLKDIHGTDVIFAAAAGLYDFSTAARFIRPSAASGVGDVDVYIHFA